MHWLESKALGAGLLFLGSTLVLYMTKQADPWLYQMVMSLAVCGAALYGAVQSYSPPQ